MHVRNLIAFGTPNVRMRRRIIIVTMSVFSALQHIDDADLRKDLHRLIHRSQTHGRILRLQFSVNGFRIRMSRVILDYRIDSKALRRNLIPVLPQHFGNIHYSRPPFSKLTFQDKLLRFRNNKILIKL